MSAGARRTGRFGLRIGDTVGSYRIVDELGGGGMGMVYVAEHALLGRSAAVKVLRPEYGHMPEVVERFFNEARATTSIRHPGIVEVFDFGYTGDGHAFIVMELLDGVNLADHIVRARRLPFGDAMVIARRIATALAAAHARGVVHRDLKPDNVFLVADAEGGPVPQVKILDFGIAKLGAEVSRTHTGVVLGTPLYMSPEQCRGAAACDHRSDLYSLGCVLFEMLSGRPPFLGEGAGEVIAGHLMTPPPELRGLVGDVPASIAALVARLLAKEPGARGESASAVAAEIELIVLELGANRRSAVQPTVIAPPLTSSAPSRVVRSRPVRRWVSSALIATGMALAGVAAALVRTGLRSAGPAAEGDPAGGLIPPDARADVGQALRPASTPDRARAIASPTVTSMPTDAGTDAGIDARPPAPAVVRRRAPRPDDDSVTSVLTRPKEIGVDSTVPDD
ncbi:MAG: protein kinase [Deltaproteobacteria bacterium]|nr:protein kinase [Deltaproteobacteria bacterium]